MPELTLPDVTALIDNREQLPFDLAPMKEVVRPLLYGDYSAVGMEHRIAIERKGFPGDLLAVCGRERPRFERQLIGMRGYDVNVVVIEGSWRQIEMGQWRSQLTPKQVHASLCAWISRGHNIILAGNRENAQRITRDIIFYACRDRVRQVRALIDSVTKDATHG